jgi:Cu(I)/Ag(I) efflux system membrane fusion protein
VPILAPSSGYIIEKNVVEGATVEPGARLYRIVDLDQIWIEAQIYESDVPLVEVGNTARISLPYQPGWESEGRVSFVYPYLDETTRTGTVRIELANADMALKPEMYANVELEKSLGERLAIPENAVLYAGDRSFVFVDLGEGRLKPKAVEVGRRAGDLVEIRDGLDEGDLIVTSGNFLVAAESRLKVDMEHWK